MQHRAKKRFGQNFLVDQNTIHKIIDCINPQDEECIVEIGPGLGALTKPLLNEIGNIDVIELDRDLIPRLAKHCDHHAGLRIHESDILKFDFATLSSNNSKLRVIGNLPYNISTAILFHLLSYRDHIIDMHFMLQKEVVERIASTPGCHAYGRLSVMMQTWFETTPLFTVSASCFNPAPKVESAIIRLKPDNTYLDRIHNAKQFETLVRQAFSQRRKTLRNNLKPICDETAIKQAGIDPSQRAEQLSVDSFVRLHGTLIQKG